MFGGIQPIYTGDRHRRQAGPDDPGAHLVQHRAQVDDVGLTRGVVDRRDALGEHGGHQDVLRRTHRRELQLNLRAVQVICLRDHTAVLDVAVGAELSQPGLMHVQWSRTDGVTAG